MYITAVNNWTPDSRINDWFARIILDNELLDKTNKTEDSFTNDDYKLLFRTIIDIRKSRIDINPVSISEKLGGFWLSVTAQWLDIRMKYNQKLLDDICRFCGTQKTCIYCNY